MTREKLYIALAALFGGGAVCLAIWLVVTVAVSAPYTPIVAKPLGDPVLALPGSLADEAVEPPAHAVPVRATLTR